MYRDGGGDAHCGKVVLVMPQHRNDVLPRRGDYRRQQTDSLLRLVRDERHDDVRGVCACRNGSGGMDVNIQIAEMDGDTSAVGVFAGALPVNTAGTM